MAQKIDQLQMHMLEKIADLHSVPEGAYNIRSNGALTGRNTTANIDIVSKADKPGIDIIIKPGTKNESVHIPVIVSQSGLKDLVYNDFYIGEDADVTIVAGCGIHCGGDDTTEHDGIHTFHIGKNAKIKYVEKHYGEGDGAGERILNPTTVIEMDEGSYMEMETTQIKGVGLHHPGHQRQAWRRGDPDHQREDYDPWKAVRGDEFPGRPERRGFHSQRGLPFRGEGKLQPGLQFQNLR